jgi:VCBS repeat-containing protein
MFIKTYKMSSITDIGAANRRSTKILFFVLTVFSAFITVLPNHARAQAPEPLVAIHVSELTQALETMPAASTDTGFQWRYTSWRYFVAYESLKETLRSDGTPFVAVSDSDIAAGSLRNPDGSPRYPILISLASEAIADNEIAALRDYVSAGGFVFAGSSAFTRYPDGSDRGDFALANEMGLHMANSHPSASNDWNFYQNSHFTRNSTHRLTSHIPSGTLAWRGPLYSEEIPWGVTPIYELHGPHYTEKVVAGGATVLATGDSGPLLTVRKYGQGEFIFHGTMQPLIGHGMVDPGMYAYLIYRSAIEWAFESLGAPIVRLSPWRYPYDAALLIRHDGEQDIPRIKTIKSSAQFEHSIGAKGDYYFCTGALRTYTGSDKTSIINSLRDAVSLYGATIGSHNGGLKNPVDSSPLTPSDWQYWHWGPDEALDITPPGYSSGKAYATSSISTSFNDINGWLTGLDNGRLGCGTARTCPRTWVAPLFNACREGSSEILQQLGAITMGEQKIGPYPHWTISYNTPGKHYSHLSLPSSDWYVGTDIPDALDMGHTITSIRGAVDSYYELGMLLNFCGHEPSNDGGVAQEYVTRSMAKPGVWSTNAVGIYDWWLKRSTVNITPSFTSSGNSYVLTTSISGSTDSNTAIEIALPAGSQYSGDMQVFLDESQASSSDYRTTNQGIKIRVGTTVSNVRVQNSSLPVPVAVEDSYATNANATLNQAAPGVLGNDSDPDGAILTTLLVTGTSHGVITLNTDGSFNYSPTTNYVGSDSFTYMANNGATNSNVAAVTISITSTGNVLLSDDFTRVPNAPAPLSPWTSVMGSWTVTNGLLLGSGTDLPYSHIYYAPTPLWDNYSVEGRFKFPSSAFGGGLGCRLNPATGAQYGSWIYPDNSLGGANSLELVKLWDWTSWGGTAMAYVSLPSVGTGWHTLKLVCNGSRIQVFYDGTQKIDVTDSNFDSRGPYLSGGIGVSMGTFNGLYTMSADDVVVNAITAANTPPLAVNDSYSTYTNTPLNLAAPGVLSNDTDAEGSTLTAQLVSGPSHGTLTLNANGSFTYTPAAGYAGSDIFTYMASDGTNTSNVATVTFTVSSTLNSLVISPTSVTGGTSSQGTVTLTSPAPSGGVVVTLSDNSSAASEPSTVTVAAGSTTAAFTITTTSVTTATSVTISAVYGGVTKTATLTVNPAVALSALSVSPTSVTGGTSSQGTVTLTSAAPSGGVVVTLSDNSSAASEPSTVTVPAGSTSATFTIATIRVTSTTYVTISARYLGVTKRAILRVNR